MSLASYVIGKGVKTLELGLEDEHDPISKMSIITEEILYRKLMSQHKSFMFFLMFFHICLLLLTGAKIMFNTFIEEAGFFC